MFAGTNLFAKNPVTYAATFMYDEYFSYNRSCCSLASFEYNSDTNILIFIDCIISNGFMITTAIPTTIIDFSLFNNKIAGTNTKFTIDSNIKILLRYL